MDGPSQPDTGHVELPSEVSKTSSVQKDESSSESSQEFMIELRPRTPSLPSVSQPMYSQSQYSMGVFIPIPPPSPIIQTVKQPEWDTSHCTQNKKEQLVKLKRSNLIVMASVFCHAFDRCQIIGLLILPPVAFIGSLIIGCKLYKERDNFKFISKSKFDWMLVLAILGDCFGVLGIVAITFMQQYFFPLLIMEAFLFCYSFMSNNILDTIVQFIEKHLQLEINKQSD